MAGQNMQGTHFLGWQNPPFLGFVLLSGSSGQGFSAEDHLIHPPEVKASAKQAEGVGVVEPQSQKKEGEVGFPPGRTVFGTKSRSFQKQSFGGLYLPSSCFFGRINALFWSL